MECLNQLLLNVRPSEGAGSSEQESRASSKIPAAESSVSVDVSCHVNHQLKNILSGKIMLNAICFVFTRYNDYFKYYRLPFALMLINLKQFVIKLIAAGCKLTSLLCQRFYKTVSAISHQRSNDDS